MYHCLGSGTCHSRWCPYYLPAFIDNISKKPVTAFCTEVTYSLQNILNSPRDRLFIEENSGWLLQLQEFPGISVLVGIWTWVVVILMMTCAFLLCVSVVSERGGRKVAMVGGPLYLAFMAFIAGFIRSGYDTVFYPITGAMSVAALSYFFASFQYSIGLTYELASATALVFTMFPIWSLLTVNYSRLHDYDYTDRKSVKELIILVTTMLMLSVLWIIHSCIYRTVMFKASWIAAFKKQQGEAIRNQEETIKNPNEGRDFMSGLWVLSGAQGHPTWRTPTGQSFGLYLTVLSWVVTAKNRMYFGQGNYCREELRLFDIILWAPPVVLTLAVLVTQFSMCMKALYDVQGNIKPLKDLKPYMEEAFTKPLKDLKPYMEEAIVSYRLGRDTLVVEDSYKVKTWYKTTFCGMKMNDKCLATSTWYIELVLMFLMCPGIFVCKISQWLGLRSLRCFLPTHWPDWCQFSSVLSRNRKAYEVLRENCSVAIQSTTDVDEGVRTLLTDRGENIRLSLVLHNTDPSGLEYLLGRLVEVLNRRPGDVLPGGQPGDTPHGVPPADAPQDVPPGDVPHGMPPGDAPREGPHGDTPHGVPNGDTPRKGLYVEMVIGENWSNEETVLLDRNRENGLNGGRDLESRTTSPVMCEENDSKRKKALESETPSPTMNVDGSNGLKALNSRNTSPISSQEDDSNVDIEPQS